MENLWERYGRWLMKHVGMKKKDYNDLMKYLHHHSFLWKIEKDQNRIKDGEYLRNDFIEEEFKDDPRYDDIFDSISCSILEMLVALACRIDTEYIGTPGDRHPEKLFKEMLYNLRIDSDTPSYIISQRLDIWMGRKFLSDGTGSICPLRNTDRNQRDVEIWSQMMEYISENYI